MKKSLSESYIFKEKWLNHFKGNNFVFNFPCFEGISFFKSKYLPIFQSIGGSSFMLSNDYKQLSLYSNNGQNGVFVIYNIPSYNNKSYDSLNHNNKLKLKKIRDYDGYMVDFSNYVTIDDYFKTQLGSKKYGNIRRRQRKLEQCFNIWYELYYKINIDKDLYLMLMTEFKKLLIKKFYSKKEFYLFTSDGIWEFYTDLIREMILNGEASLFVVSNDDKPISFYLSYHFDSYVLGAMPVFDLNYSKFGLGAVTIKKLFEYLYEMGIKKFDFYKGEYGYKKDYCNITYSYHHHLVYSKTLLSITIANLLSFKFKLKQYLIKKGVNDLYYKMLFRLKNPRTQVFLNYKTSEIDDNEISKMNLELISYLDNEYEDIRRIVYEFLFSNNEFIGNISLYKNNETGFIIKNKNKNLYIIYKE